MGKLVGQTVPVTTVGSSVLVVGGWLCHIPPYDRTLIKEVEEVAQKACREWAIEKGLMQGPRQA